MVGGVEVVGVECFKCGERGHKCRECLLWEKKVKRVMHCYTAREFSAEM